jgi:ADP-ribosylglycohydrolase
MIELLQSRATSPQFKKALELVSEHLAKASTGPQFAEALGCSKGITGYILHTVPAALFCWLRHPGDFRSALEEIICLGGDADTTAAIVGGLAGASLGCEAIPTSWLAGLVEWPRNVDWIQKLGGRLHRQFPAEGQPQTQRPMPLTWPLLPLRNAFFLIIVLGHGFRRLLPPY